MHDLAFIVVTYAALVVGGLTIGYCWRWGIDLWRVRRERRIAATRISFGAAFPIVDEWAKRERWYLSSEFLRDAAEVEHRRLLRDEPELTVEQNLSRVAIAVKARYPGAFRMLH